MKADTGLSTKPDLVAGPGVLVALSLCMLLSSLSTSIANVALPTLAKAFDVPFQSVQWVVLAYLLAITTLIVTVGKLSDLIGRRRLLLQGLTLFLGASVVAGLAPDLGVLIAARAVQGAGAAVMMALTMAFVSQAVAKEKTGSMMGMLGTMSAVGTALGPTLGGGLIALEGWRTIFAATSIVGLAALFLAWRFLPRDRPSQTKGQTRIDWAGAALLAVTLALYALSMTLGRGHFGGLNAALLLAASVVGSIFLMAQTQAASPLLPLHLFRNPALSAGLASSLLVSTVVMASLVVGPFYLAGALSLDTAHVGLVMSAGPLMAAISGVPSGRLVDRFGAHRMTMAGLLTVVTGALVLSLTPLSVGLIGYVLPIMVVTAGYALFQTANNTGVMSGVAADQRGLISGVLNLSRNLGLITGAAAMGAVFAAASGSADVTTASPQGVANGMHATFAVAAGLVGLAIAAGVFARARPVSQPSRMEI